MRKFKKRVDLVTFAMEHPGALAAHFANKVHEQMGSGVMRRSRQLRDVPYTKYIGSDAFGLSELRDRREAMTLATVMEKLNKDEVSEAMDLISMRLLALQEAKQKGGSWEKASLKELIAPATTGGGLQMAGLSSMG